MRPVRSAVMSGILQQVGGWRVGGWAGKWVGGCLGGCRVWSQEGVAAGGSTGAGWRLPAARHAAWGAQRQRHRPTRKLSHRPPPAAPSAPPPQPNHTPQFIKAFFDENPLSQLGLIVLRNGVAERLTELSSSPVGAAGGWWLMQLPAGLILAASGLPCAGGTHRQSRQVRINHPRRSEGRTPRSAGGSHRAAALESGHRRRRQPAERAGAGGRFPQGHPTLWLQARAAAAAARSQRLPACLPGWCASSLPLVLPACCLPGLRAPTGCPALGLPPRWLAEKCW